MNETWFSPFITMDIGLIDKVLRTVAVYLGIALLIRVAGKRLMAQMNSLDLVVVLLLSNVVQNAIIGPDNSVLGGLIGAVVLVAANAGVDWWARSNRRVAAVLEGEPTPLVADGVVDDRALRNLGITSAELRVALQRMGADRVDQVATASLEPGGDIVMKLKPEQQNVTKADLEAAVAELRDLIVGRR